MNKLIIAGILLLFFGGVKAEVISDSTIIHVSGTVTNINNNQPVSDHEVMLFGLSSDIHQTSFTDASGYFLFEIFPSSDLGDSIQLITFGNCFGDYLSYTKNLYIDSTNIYTTFEICHVNDTIDCQALFSHFIIDENTVEFMNLSQTNDTVQWIWDFGDGETSTEFSPVHTYETGNVFEACLMIMSPLCNDIYCETISLSGTTFYYGHAMMDGVTFPDCKIRLAPADLGNFTWYETLTDSSGFFNFINVPVGSYLLEAIPEVDFANYTPQLFPTYYPSELFWENALPAEPEVANYIEYRKNPTINYGSSNISGTIHDPMHLLEKKPSVLLFDNQMQPVKFSQCSLDGNFSFNNIDEGEYTVYPQLAGYITEPITLSLSNNSSRTVNFITDMNIFMPDPLDIQSEEIKTKIYPNPAKNKLFISSTEKIFNISLVNSSGKIVFASKSDSYHKKISLKNFLPGIYILHYTTHSNSVAKKIIVK